MHFEKVFRISKILFCHLAGYGGDEDADSGSDQGAGIPHSREALGLDEHRHLGRELGEVRLDVVLEDETGQQPEVQFSLIN